MFLAIEYLILFEITKNKQEAAKTITILTLCVYAFKFLPVSVIFHL